MYTDIKYVSHSTINRPLYLCVGVGRGVSLPTLWVGLHTHTHPHTPTHPHTHTHTHTHLYWHHWFWLFGEDNPTIEEGRDNLVDKQVHFVSCFFFKVLIHVDTLYHPTRQQTVSLPLFIILHTQFGGAW